jgi:hypothetical protein
MQPSRCETPAAPIVTAGEVTERVGDELLALADAMYRLQCLISPLILEAAARNPAHLHELQDIDHIAQKLGNLGNFVTTLAAHMPSHWHVDPTTASQVVTLSDLSSRLSFANEGAANDHHAGDFELF